MPIVLGLLFAFLMIACSDKEGSFLQPPTAASAEVSYLITASGDSNTRSVVVYQADGALYSLVKNFRTDLGTPRGLGAITPTEILVSLDNTDRVHRLGWAGDSVGTDEIFTTSGLGGAIYDMEADSLGNVYVLESNRIERYDSTGAQVGNPYISATLGSCSLNSPRGMHLTSNNQLIVTDYNNDVILIYDVSTLTASCVSSNGTVLNPYGIILHSDGFLYFTNFSDDQVWRANGDGSGGAVLTTATTTQLNNPSAIVELPNGNLAVASSATDAVWEIDTSGNFVSSSPLILDPLSLNITDMMVVNVTQ